MRSNYALQRIVNQRGPRLAAAHAPWPPAERDRYASQSFDRS